MGLRSNGQFLCLCVCMWGNRGAGWGFSCLVLVAVLRYCVIQGGAGARVVLAVQHVCCCTVAADGSDCCVAHCIAVSLPPVCLCRCLRCFCTSCRQPLWLRAVWCCRWLRCPPM